MPAKLNKNGTEKTKILFLGDIVLAPTGVGTQGLHLFKGLVDTGRYRVVQMGGAVKHNSMQPIIIGEYKEDFKIFPVNGYGDENILRALLAQEKPDGVFIFTDPRFFMWLWFMSDEIRRTCPLFYWHLWDNYPTPEYNQKYYFCNDYIGYINKQTGKMLQELFYSQKRMSYIPHGLNPQKYVPLTADQKQAARDKFLKGNNGKFVFLWVSRNARRKRAGDMVKAFAEFNKQHPGKALLYMKTEVVGDQGPNLEDLSRIYNLRLNMDIIVEPKIFPDDDMVSLYGMADCLINNSNAEGFGLSVLHSMMAGVPVIAVKTGGLQDQIVHNETGWLLDPAEKIIIGNDITPYIYEDVNAEKDLVNSMEHVFLLDEKERETIGKAARKRAEQEFDIKQVVQKWDDIFQSVIGSYNVADATIQFCTL